MCPAAGYAFFGGARGPRPTGCGGHTGRTGSSAPTKQNKNRAKGDVEDAVPYNSVRDVGDGVPYDFCAGRGGGGEALICR